MKPRLATTDDVAAIAALIERSARALSVGFYTAEQIDAAVRHVFGVDTQLIADGTYYVIDAPDGVAAAGGWSARRTLFGGDQMKRGEDSLLDPSVDAARIRAFFVDPQWARRGLASALYDACAAAARARGFRTLELMATAPGEPLYAHLGFVVRERVELALPPGVSVPFARMTRDIAATEENVRKDELSSEQQRGIDELLADFERQLARVNVDLASVSGQMNETTAPTQAPIEGRDPDEEFTETHTIDLSGIMETLRQLPDSAGTAAFIAAYNRAHPDWRNVSTTES